VLWQKFRAKISLAKDPGNSSRFRRSESTPDDDPAHLYADVAVRIDRARKANNGMPVGVVHWLDALDLHEGDTVIHAGYGTGYYTALIATALAGPPGGFAPYNSRAEKQ
jgi:protein-L-isoaspartate(D-aspartate) O-methyltransferase